MSKWILFLLILIFHQVTAAVNTDSKIISPTDLIKILNKEKLVYRETGRVSGFFSIDSCLFTSKNFVVLKNYCFPKRAYPSRGVMIYSPEYGAFEFYEENSSDQQFRTLRHLVFKSDLNRLLKSPVEDIDIKKINAIKDYFYKDSSRRACWATNLSRYSKTPRVGCIKDDINNYPRWKSEASIFTIDEQKWHEYYDILSSQLNEPAFAKLNQIYKVRHTLPLDALFTPIKKYEDIVSTLKSLETQFPKNAKVFKLGTSNTGEIIYGLKIGSGDISNLVVGTHHGNEYGSTEVAEALAKDFSQNPIPGQTIYIIPVLNVNGYNRRTRLEKSETGKNHDPNRDYPGPCGTSGPFHLNSTKALAGLLAAANIINSVTLHTYYPAVLYPWGLSTHDLDTGYNDMFRKLSFYATSFSNYKVGNSTEELYPADGTFEDYAFWKHGIWSLLFEMGDSHNPGVSQVEDMIAVNVPGIRKLFEFAPTVRAENHSFKGRCNRFSILFDRRDE